jgi:HK97 family phage major capsid protein
MKLPMQRRTLEIDREALATRAEGEERIPVSFSSDARVRQRFGLEVLDHSPGAVNMEYAKNGLPFLVAHSRGQLAGRVENIAFAGGRGRGWLRTGRSPFAREIRQDIEDGIRPDLSVGYRVDELVLEGLDGDDKVYRATRWTPMEVSSEPIPADVSVGAYRNAEALDEFPVKISDQSDPDTPEVRSTTMTEPITAAAPVGVVQEPRETEAKLVAAAARTFKMESKLPEWIGRGLTLEQVRGEIEAEQVRAASATPPPGHVDLTPKEERAYNPLAAIFAIADGKWERGGGLEKEVSDAVAQRMGRPPRSFYLPMNVRSVTGNVVGTPGLGGHAVETQLVGFIDLLRARMKVRAMGATVMTGLKGNLAIPRQITANAVSWVGENPATGVGLTALTLDQVTMTPKVAMGSTAYSRLAAHQTTPDVSALVLNDLALTAALAVDSAAINGTGSSNQPTGVRLTSGINTRPVGANGGALTWALLVGAETEIAVDNADVATMGWLTTPGVRGSAKTILKSATAGSHFLWSDDNKMNGYRAEVSTQVPSNLTKGTSNGICHAAIFGDWSQLMIGEWGGALDVLVDPYKYADKGMVAVYSYLTVDVAVRQPSGFCLIPDILV